MGTSTITELLDELAPEIGSNLRPGRRRPRDPGQRQAHLQRQRDPQPLTESILRVDIPPRKLR